MYKLNCSIKYGVNRPNEEYELLSENLKDIIFDVSKYRNLFFYDYFKLLVDFFKENNIIINNLNKDKILVITINYYFNNKCHNHYSPAYIEISKHISFGCKYVYFIDNKICYESDIFEFRSKKYIRLDKLNKLKVLCLD